MLIFIVDCLNLNLCTKISQRIHSPPSRFKGVFQTHRIGHNECPTKGMFNSLYSKITKIPQRSSWVEKGKCLYIRKVARLYMPVHVVMARDVQGGYIMHNKGECKPVHNVVKHVRL